MAQDFPADVTILTNGNGDANASHGAGAGRVVSDGAAWKSVYSGASAA